MELLKMNLEDVEEIEPILLEEFDDFWSSNVLKEEIKNETRSFIVAKENKEILGFAGISFASRRHSRINEHCCEKKQKKKWGTEQLY